MAGDSGESRDVATAARVEHIHERAVEGDADRIRAARRDTIGEAETAIGTDEEERDVVAAGIDRRQPLPVDGEGHRALGAEPGACAGASRREGAAQAEGAVSGACIGEDSIAPRRVGHRVHGATATKVVGGDASGDAEREQGGHKAENGSESATHGT